MCCEARAEIVLAGEGNFRDCFEDGGFTGGLVPTDDDLRERDELIDAIRAELVDFVEEVELLE